MDTRLRRNIGWLVALAGVVIVLIGALADSIGLGGEGPNDFGGRQLAAVIVGILVLAAGLVVALWPPQASSRGEDQPAPVGSGSGESA